MLISAPERNASKAFRPLSLVYSIVKIILSVQILKTQLHLCCQNQCISHYTYSSPNAKFSLYIVNFPDKSYNVADVQVRYSLFPE